MAPIRGHPPTYRRHSDLLHFSFQEPASADSSQEISSRSYSPRLPRLKTAGPVPSASFAAQTAPLQPSYRTSCGCKAVRISPDRISRSSLSSLSLLPLNLSSGLPSVDFRVRNAQCKRSTCMSNPVATQTFPPATVPVSGLQRLHRFIQQQNDFSPGDGSVPAEDFFFACFQRTVTIPAIKRFMQPCFNLSHIRRIRTRLDSGVSTKQPCQRYSAWHTGHQKRFLPAISRFRTIVPHTKHGNPFRR